MNNVSGALNERVVAKLSVQPPSAFLVQTYLEKIADEYHVQWKPQVKLSAEAMAEAMAAPVGYSVQVAHGTQLAPALAQHIPGAHAVPSAPPSGKDTGEFSVATHYVPQPAPSNDEFEEPDIFIPAAPGQKGSSTGGGSSGPRDNDDEDNNNDNSGDSSSYADLKARFAQLSKK